VKALAVALLLLIGAPLLIGLSGCGQKGQLYLPSQKKTKVPPPPSPSPAAPGPPATPETPPTPGAAS